MSTLFITVNSLFFPKNIRNNILFLPREGDKVKFKKENWGYNPRNTYARRCLNIKS